MKAQDIRFETKRTLVLENATHVEKVSTNTTPAVIWGICIPHKGDTLITGTVIESFSVQSGPASKRPAYYSRHDFIEAIDNGKIEIKETKEA